MYIFKSDLLDGYTQYLAHCSGQAVSNTAKISQTFLSRLENLLESPEYGVTIKQMRPGRLRGKHKPRLYVGISFGPPQGFRSNLKIVRKRMGFKTQLIN